MTPQPHALPVVGLSNREEVLVARTSKPKAGVEWEAPPSAGRPDWGQVAEELRAHPYQWLKVFKHGRTSWKEAMAQGHVAAVHPNLGFEYQSSDNRRGTPRTCTLFMRYNPEAADLVAELIEQAKEQ